jgi:hypothetical protein
LSQTTSLWDNEDKETTGGLEWPNKTPSRASWFAR